MAKKIILKRKLAEGDSDSEYFRLFSGDYQTLDDGYGIYWYLSSQKKKLDKSIRQKRVSRADSRLMELSLKLNKRELKTEEKIREEIEAILNKYRVKDFFKFTVSKNSEEIKKQITKGSMQIPIATLAIVFKLTL